MNALYLTIYTGTELTFDTFEYKLRKLLILGGVISKNKPSRDFIESYIKGEHSYDFVFVNLSEILYFYKIKTEDLKKFL